MKTYKFNFFFKTTKNFHIYISFNIKELIIRYFQSYMRIVFHLMKKKLRDVLSEFDQQEVDIAIFISFMWIQKRCNYHKNYKHLKIWSSPVQYTFLNTKISIHSPIHSNLLV